MAQRTVHYVFGQLLAERCGLEDAPRFLFGTLLPDAVAKDERDASHYALVSPENLRCYDFVRFRREFAARIPADPLCLGYYMHLVEDSFYRFFFRREYNYYFTTPEAMSALYRDYHLLNPRLRDRYALVNRLALPADWADEPLRRIAHFDAEGLLRDFAEDLREEPEGAFDTMTPEIIERFLTKYLPLAEGELRAVLRRETLLRPQDFAWEKKQK